MRTHYYISGMPRAGSTLLCNILAQNPNFYVSPTTSGCHDVLLGIRNQWDKLVEHRAEGASYAQLNRVLLAVMNSYHNTDKPVVIDKGRGWLSLIEMIEFIKGNPPKIIVPVRGVAEIMASFETLWRGSTGMTQWDFEASDYAKAQTTEGRCDIWAGPSQPIGMAYNRVKDAIVRAKPGTLLFVEFDDLTSEPSKTMERIYSFLGEPNFSHDFDNANQYTMEDDINIHRIPGLHSIRSKVAPVPHRARSVLGVQLSDKYNGSELWRPR